MLHSAIILSLLALAQAVPAPVQRSGRILGGEEAEPHSIPYVVYLQSVIFDDDDGKFSVLSDGVLITPNAVLTAAETFDIEFLRVEILFGAHQVLPIPDSEIVRISNISEVLVHPNYTDSPLENNIAICRFQEPVELNGIVNVVPLPFNPDNDYVGELATVSGWGASEDAEVVSNVLRKVEVEVISNEECGNPGNGTLCTSAEDGKSVCTVDLGGPLVSSAGELIGMVINEKPCDGEQVTPSYYIRISSYLRWIAQNV